MERGKRERRRGGLRCKLLREDWEMGYVRPVKDGKGAALGLAREGFE